jgi:hypothetical protein
VQGGSGREIYAGFCFRTQKRRDAISPENGRMERAKKEPSAKKQKGELRSPFYQFSQMCLLVLPYSALAVSAPIARAYFLPEKRISFSDFLPSLLTVVTAELRSGV